MRHGSPFPFFEPASAAEAIALCAGHGGQRSPGYPLRDISVAWRRTMHTRTAPMAQYDLGTGGHRLPGTVAGIGACRAKRIERALMPSLLSSHACSGAPPARVVDPLSVDKRSRASSS